ncbi:MAG TPA: FKBP-type peptidyl-prolyl cis-trans isomerase [Candidatus Saccharimonadales bacterium]
MVRTRDRVIALVIAITFFATSVGLSFIVIWQLYQDSKANKETKTVDQAKLEGTKLTDFTPVEKVDSLQKIDLKEGTGKEVKPGGTVTVDYTGAIAATGIIFQSSLDSGRPFSTPLDGVIKGWTEGIPGMKEGGRRRLIIPAEMAYGANPPSGIPANAALVFDVTLVSVDQ